MERRKTTKEEELSVYRFITAQKEFHAYAVRELRQGRKRTHWMWYEFPQIYGLGYSEMSKYYAIHSRAELQKFAYDKTLSRNLSELFRILVKSKKTNPIAIFGDIDAQKLQSCLSLFRHTEPFEMICELLLCKFFNGVADANTDRLYYQWFSQE